MFRKTAFLLFSCLAICCAIACQKHSNLIKSPAQASNKFTISSWSNVEADFDSIEWIERLDSFEVWGISELLVGAGVQSLKRFVPLARERGFSVHAWTWTLNRPNDSIAMRHPEWYAVNRLADNSLEYRAYVDYYQWLSPWHPDARDHIKKAVGKLLEIEGLSSIHLDYVRYVDVILGNNLQPKYGLDQTVEMPEYDFGYHPIARDSFKSIFGTDPLDMEHPELSNEWRQFRMNAVTSLVNEIAEMVHAEGQQLSAAVFPFPEMSRKMVRQDWSSWHLDRAYPMLYHNFYNQNIAWIGFALEQGLREADFPLYAGLYMPAFKNAGELKKAIELCRQKGASGVSLFTAMGLDSESANVLKSGVSDN